MSARRTASALLAFLLVAGSGAAEPLRVAVWNAGLYRDGPGLLLRDVLAREAQAVAAAEVVRAAAADVLVITGIDHDLKNRALGAFLDLVREGKDGIDYPHRFAPPPNAGFASGLDLDGDGRRSGWGDGWGWGKFPGHAGMAIASRLPLGAARTFRLLPWSALPGASLPEHADGRPWPDGETRAAMRLSSRSHWDVALALPGGERVHLLVSYPTPPVFDGPEGRNLRRNHDEIDFWRHYLDGWAAPDDAGQAAPGPEAPVIVLGSLNADPADGDGLRVAVQRLLEHPRLQDPAPRSPGGDAAARQGGANRHHFGDPALDTADWRDEGGPGNLRVDYVLPDARLAVVGAGVLWPERGAPLAEAVEAASPHRLVWVDLAGGGLDRGAGER